MKTLLIPLTLGLLLCLPACGGAASAGETTDPDPNAADQAHEDAPIELTDALMEQYVQIIKEAKGAADKGSLAFLARYGWSLERWTKVVGAVSAGMVSAMQAQMADSAAKTMQDVDRQIQDLKERGKTAKGEEKKSIDAQLEVLEGMKAMQTGAQLKVTDLDRRNAAVVERWRPRIEAIEQGK